jgi:hypothetical protein
MIVSTSLAKVGHRQAPHSKNPITPIKSDGVFYLLLPEHSALPEVCLFTSEFIARIPLIFAHGLVEFVVAGLLALLGREPGQVRKEAAPATDASAGGQARHFLILQILYELPGPRAQVAPEII